MSKDYLSSNNFRTRLATGVVLLVLVFLTMITPNAIAFRVLYLGAGAIAALELFLAHRAMNLREVIRGDERFIIMEYGVLILSAYSFLTYLSFQEIVLVLVGAVATDTFAYFAGSSLHGVIFKKRPFPKTSPKKSWEGIIGGCLGCIILIFIFATIFKIDNQPRYIVFAFLCPVFSIFGDYSASLCKRLVGIKDSYDIILESNLTPVKFCEKFVTGHGGYLDRLDSVSMVACLMFVIKFTTSYPQ